MTEKPAPAVKRNIRQVDIQERRKEALRLRLLGRGYQGIADEMGCSVATAHDLVKTAIEALPRQNAVELRAQEAEKLRDIYEKTRAKVDSTRSLTALKAALVCVRIAERLSKLEGLDAPSKHELTGSNGGPIELLATASERINSRLDRLSSVGAPASNAPRDSADVDRSNGA